MTWPRLSSTALASLHELRAAAATWVGRTRRVTAALETLAVLGEPALIPQVVGVLFDPEPAVARMAAAILEALWARLPPELLPALDEAMRREWWGAGGPAWPPLRPADIGRVPRGEVMLVLPLGLVSMHPSGHVREAALARLDEGFVTAAITPQGSGELAFLLLRLDDWVEPVRRRAEVAVARRLDDLWRPHFLVRLDLLARLRGRTRAAGSTTLAAALETFLAGDLPALLAASLAPGTPTQARRYGAELAWRMAAVRTRGGEPPSSTPSPVAAAERVLDALLDLGGGGGGHNPDPALRRQAARWVLEALADDGQEDGVIVAARWRERYLPGLLADRSAAVRRLALGWAAEREGARHLPTLRAALLDPSMPARALAQFYLPRLEEPAPDLRAFYRAEVERWGRRERGDDRSAGGRRALRAALAGLGECGRPEDDALLLPFTGEELPAGVRRIALAALARLNPGPHLELFWEALRGNAPGLSQQARRALESLVPQLGAGRLGALLRESSSCAHVHVNALFLAARLPKWAALPLLVEAAGRGWPAGEPPGDMAGRLLRGWLAAYNRTYTISPAAADLGRLREALERHGRGLDPGLLRELRGLLNALRS